MGLARESRTLKHGEIFILSDQRGDVRRSLPGAGMYFRDTRFLSEYWLLLNGAEPELLDSSADLVTDGIFVFSNPVFRTEDGHDVAPHTITLQRCRSIGQALRDTFLVQNFNAFPVTLELTLVFAADFLDIFEVRGWPRERPRGLQQLPQQDGSMVHLSYRAPDGLVLETEIAFSQPPDITTVEPGSAEVRLAVPPRLLLPGHDVLVRAPSALRPPRVFTTFRLALPARGTAELGVRITPRQLLQHQQRRRIPDVAATAEAPTKATLPFAQVQTDHELFNRVLDRSLRDIEALMTPFPGGPLVAAGIPWFVAPFGRDSLIVALQLLLFTPELATDVLRFLARYQGKQVNAWTEEEPGKILHELRFGEMTRLGETPHTPYYGTVDATPLFIVLFCELMDWMGSPSLFEEFWPAIEAALGWITRYGDRDHDGFVDYGKQSPRGLVHQNWKDSANSLQFPDGVTEVAIPIAPVEVQGYIYQAKRGLAAVLQRYGNAAHHALAARLRAEAEQLRQRFEQRFWSEADQFYGQAIDGKGRLVNAISSNPGHCLFSGIVSPERAALVARRLLASDLYSGWGIRTLSRTMPHYNPMSYHNGSVWPHDNALAIAGLRRYGFDQEACTVITDLLSAAEQFPSYRLPELFCGFGRDETPCALPVSYPVSCSPQAWAAGTMPFLLRVMLGVEPRAAERRLVLRPAFPDWLHEVEVRGMRFAGRTLDLRVSRTDRRYTLEWQGASDVQVLIATGGGDGS